MSVYLVITEDGEFETFKTKMAAEKCIDHRGGTYIGKCDVKQRFRSCRRK